VSFDYSRHVFDPAKNTLNYDILAPVGGPSRPRSVAMFQLTDSPAESFVDNAKKDLLIPNVARKRAADFAERAKQYAILSVRHMTCSPRLTSRLGALGLACKKAGLSRREMRSCSSLPKASRLGGSKTHSRSRRSRGLARSASQGKKVRMEDGGVAQ